MPDVNPISLPCTAPDPLPLGHAEPPVPRDSDNGTPRRRRAIEALSRRVVPTGEPERLMNDAAALLAEALDLPLAGTAGLSPDGGTLRIRVQPSGEPPSEPWETPATAEGALAAHALATGRSVVVPDLEKDPRFEDWLLGCCKARAALAVPLVLEERRFGVLLAADRRPRELRDDDVLWAESIAQVVSATLARWTAERHLEQQRRLAGNLLETLESLVFALDAQWRIVECNRACRRVMEREWDELAGRCFWDLFADAEQADLFRQVVEEGDPELAPFGSEAAMLTGVSGERQIVWSIREVSPVEDEPCRFIATGIDVTEQRAAEERARRAEVAAGNPRIPPAPAAGGTAQPAHAAGSPSTASGSGPAEIGPFGVLPDSANFERRRKPRRSFPYCQRIAPILDGKRPDLSEFQEILCNDISAGGFSFVSDASPASESYVVALGSPPKFTFLTARVAHVTPVKHEGRRRYLIGCHYVGRVVY
jgi:PAS domain-containing protein